MNDITTVEAEATINEFLASAGGDDGPLKWTDWSDIEDRFPEGEQAERLAEAYAVLWRRDGAFDEGEPMPSRYLVEKIESVIGEELFAQAVETA